MNKKDILVGRTYANSAYPGTVYLGVGVCKNIYTPNPPFIRKDLVIIKCERGDMVGRSVIHTHNKESKNFWKQFRLTEAN